MPLKLQFKFLPLSAILIFAMVVLWSIAAKSWSKTDEKKSNQLSEKQTTLYFDRYTIASDDNIFTITEWININHITLGQMGMEQSTSAEIVEFSKMLTEEHSVASKELKAIAGKKNISLPLADEKSEYDDISKLDSEKIYAFDKEFLNVVIQYHRNAIGKFEISELATTDNELKMYIETVLPTLKKHLEQAEYIQAGKLAKLY